MTYRSGGRRPQGAPVQKDEIAAESLANERFWAAQQGDPAALRALYEELSPRVLGYLRARGAVEAEDLTSEVFLTVLPRLATITGGAAGFRALLFTVAHARLVDSLRAAARRPDVVPYDVGLDQRQAPSAEQEAQVWLGAERAVAVLERLPDTQRDVLMLRILGDLTVDQVAQVLGTSAGAVKQHQRRGLLALRDLVDTGVVTL